MKKTGIILLFIAACGKPVSITHNPNQEFVEKRPKNVILLIGDGMGLSQITAGMYSNHNRLNLEQFPITGLIKTHSANHLVTDSGAGATAFACGCKTYNGAIGVDKNKNRCTTIAELAQQNGMAIGLIASSSLTHATPASFIAHVPQRSNMEAIAQWFTINTPDLAIGGGMKYFNHRTTDTLNLCEKLQQKGCRVTQLNEGSLSQLNPKPHSPFFWFAAEEEPESAEKGRDYLPIAAELAGPFLKKRSDKGFFLMLEGSQIDWACHKNDAKNAINEMLDFDACIGAILEFAHADGETLVIVTADHETGGMAIAQGSVMDSLTIHYTSDKHTASMVPVFAYGPGASQFSGIYDNTDIFHKVQRLMQLKVPKNVPRK